MKRKRTTYKQLSFTGLWPAFNYCTGKRVSHRPGLSTQISVVVTVILGDSNSTADIQLFQHKSQWGWQCSLHKSSVVTVQPGYTFNNTTDILQSWFTTLPVFLAQIIMVVTVQPQCKFNYWDSESQCNSSHPSRVFPPKSMWWGQCIGILDCVGSEVTVQPLWKN